ncbi:MAG: FprA family A-type flavoprotein [candidate division Zixibacteria bacterium]|nr:FprA family A-type flavoprotein [candidate division Zixibacteria bacterium]
MNTSLRDGIDWVGYVDWTIRDFHGYEIGNGTTYNAYLIRDEKTALIDTVKSHYGSQLLRNVSDFVELENIDYVICNHAEPDHSGALPEVMAAMPNATLVCDKKCETILSKYYDTSDWKIQIIETGDNISLGKRTLQFIETPMLHWPESMFTYVPEEKLLFSMDAFGQHYASSQRFDDEISMETILREAKSYYANIIMPYGKQTVKTIERLSSFDIDIIAPSHGLIWRSYLQELIQSYKDWAILRAKPKVLIIYETMWNSTSEMAQAIFEGASIPGVDVRLIRISSSSLAQIANEILDAATVAFGSSTLNTEMLPPVAEVLTYLKGLRPVGKAGFAFGSYGWGRGGPEAIDEYMKTMKWEILLDPIKAQYRPTAEIKDECIKAGKLLATKAKDLAEN